MLLPRRYATLFTIKHSGRKKKEERRKKERKKERKKQERRGRRGRTNKTGTKTNLYVRLMNLMAGTLLKGMSGQYEE